MDHLIMDTIAGLLTIYHLIMDHPGKTRIGHLMFNHGKANIDQPILSIFLSLYRWRMMSESLKSDSTWWVYSIILINMLYHSNYNWLVLIYTLIYKSTYFTTVIFLVMIFITFLADLHYLKTLQKSIALSHFQSLLLFLIRNSLLVLLVI